MARMQLARFAVGRIGIARAHSIDRPEVSQLFAEGDVDRSRARECFGSFERIYSFFAADNEGFKANLAAITRKPHFYPFRPPGEGHVAEAYLRTIGASEDFAASAKAELLDTDRMAASAMLRRFGLQRSEYLLVLPGSGSRTKNWPVEKFVELMRRMAGVRRTLVIIGPAEEGMAGAFQSAGIPVASDLELGTVAALADGAKAFIGNDSGVSHLAAVSGVRGLVLFGPTDPDRWRPRGRVRVIRHQPITELPIAKVEAALEAMLCDD